MSRTLKTCIECGRPGPRNRCPLHMRAHNQAEKARRPEYTSEERKRRAKAVKDHRDEYGNLCPGYKRLPHMADPTNPLTADHVVSVARGGREDGPLQVLCRSCNSRKGSRQR